ncbi:hypothetical protein [Streptomyces hainanensis]|uniref:Uncharacterized protein n=1 Tax=Streptomyces hainanensis TaxID=402648 RepID=A0A4R4SZD8_9ACTN|nr:hypothetical protein [Streptomyces hainanensis]TDC69687.1 hypothetical protein E1283_25680 [Streptomyces hainanensis]
MPEPPWEPTGRPGDFGPLGPWTLERTEYLGRTDAPVRCLPVVLRGHVIGYLWGSETEDAAGYVSRAGTGAVGFDAGGPWLRRFREARDAGLSGWEAVQLWIGEPADPRAGAIPADAAELALPDSAAARRLARSADDYARRR